MSQSQSYEYNYSSGGAGEGGFVLGSSGINSGSVTYSSETYTVGGGGSGGVIVGSSGSGYGAGSGGVIVSSGGSSSGGAGGVAGQVINDLLQLSTGSGSLSASGAGAGSGGASYQVTYTSGGSGSGAAFGAGSGAEFSQTNYVGTDGSGGYIPGYKVGTDGSGGYIPGYKVGTDGSGGYIPGYKVGAGGAAASLEASAFSAIEQAIFRANNPIAIQESETITVNGQTGIWANKAEIVNWRGVIPITQYLINEDVNPEIIRKQTEQQLIYEQEIAIRYLRPPTPPPPGEILIRQEKNIPTPPAPPLVIRQQPPRPETPAPLVIREAPPRPPAAVGAKVVTISGKRLPPPPRKVIIERLAPLPSKPQSIFIERWLPYTENKRRVIFQRNTVPDPIVAKPRNVIIQWEAPAVQIKKEFKDLGVIRANPAEYVQRYGAALKAPVELPSFVREIRPPTGVVLAAEYQAPSLLELEGDVQALNLIDLDQWGLSEYRAYLARYGNITQAAPAPVFSLPFSVSASQVVNAILTELFTAIDINSDGRVSVDEAEKVLLKLNTRLGRNYGEADVAAFFRQLDTNRDGRVDLEEFKRGVLRDLNIA